MKLALHGATGRMGKAIVEVARERRHEIVLAVAEPKSAAIGSDLGLSHGFAPLNVTVLDALPTDLTGVDVLIDFSHASVVRNALSCALASKTAFVSGTTGIDPAMEQQLLDAGSHIALAWAPNFSLGIQVLIEALRLTTRRLGAGFDVEITETHHSRKVDAPSGTALRLAKEVQAARATLDIVHGRHGMVGGRPAEELGVHALRGGDVVGDHSVHFLGVGERLELTHRATSRNVLAQGALFAAEQLLTKGPGLYTVADLLPH